MSKRQRQREKRKMRKEGAQGVLKEVAPHGALGFVPLDLGRGQKYQVLVLTGDARSDELKGACEGVPGVAVAECEAQVYVMAPDALATPEVVAAVRNITQGAD